MFFQDSNHLVTVQPLSPLSRPAASKEHCRSRRTFPEPMLPLLILKTVEGGVPYGMSKAHSIKLEPQKSDTSPKRLFRV